LFRAMDVTMILQVRYLHRRASMTLPLGANEAISS
jgi:hypothetical protein